MTVFGNTLHTAHPLKGRCIPMCSGRSFRHVDLQTRPSSWTSWSFGVFWSSWFRLCLVGWLLLCLPFTSSAQNTWTQEQIDTVFALLSAGDATAYDSPHGRKMVQTAMTLVQEQGVTPYDFGRDLFSLGEGQRALQWYEALAIATSDHQYLYGLAYYEWKLGNTDRALKDANFLLSKNPPPLIHARTSYLTGRIHLENRQYQAAERDLQAGLVAYQSIEGKYGGEFLCLTLLAEAAIHQKHFDAGINFLDRALRANERLEAAGMRPYGLGFYYELQAQIHFEQREYQEARDLFTKSRDTFLASKQHANAEEVLVKIGLMTLLCGQPKQALEIASSIHNRLETAPNPRIAMYNNVTLMKISQCGNRLQEFEERKALNLTWATSNPGGQALLELMHYIEQHPCPALEE